MRDAFQVNKGLCTCPNPFEDSPRANRVFSSCWRKAHALPYYLLSIHLLILNDVTFRLRFRLRFRLTFNMGCEPPRSGSHTSIARRHAMHACIRVQLHNAAQCLC